MDQYGLQPRLFDKNDHIAWLASASHGRFRAATVLGNCTLSACAQITGRIPPWIESTGWLNPSARWARRKSHTAWTGMIGNMTDFLVQTHTHAITGFPLAAVQKLDARWIRGTLTFGGLKQQLRYSKGCEYHVAVGNGNEVSSGILVSQTLTPFFPNNPLMSFQTCNLNTSPGRWLWKLPWYRRWRTQVQRRGHDSTIRRNCDTIYNMI